jgi:hypothetical protein
MVTIARSEPAARKLAAGFFMCWLLDRRIFRKRDPCSVPGRRVAHLLRGRASRDSIQRHQAALEQAKARTDALHL